MDYAVRYINPQNMDLRFACGITHHPVGAQHWMHSAQSAPQPSVHQPTGYLPNTVLPESMSTTDSSHKSHWTDGEIVVQECPHSAASVKEHKPFRAAVIRDNGGFVRLGLEQAGLEVVGFDTNPVSVYMGQFVGQGKVHLVSSIQEAIKQAKDFDAVFVMPIRRSGDEEALDENCEETTVKKEGSNKRRSSSSASASAVERKVQKVSRSPCKKTSTLESDAEAKNAENRRIRPLVDLKAEVSSVDVEVRERRQSAQHPKTESQDSRVEVVWTARDGRQAAVPGSGRHQTRPFLSPQTGACRADDHAVTGSRLPPPLSACSGGSGGARAGDRRNPVLQRGGSFVGPQETWYPGFLQSPRFQQSPGRMHAMGLQSYSSVIPICTTPQMHPLSPGSPYFPPGSYMNQYSGSLDPVAMLPVSSPMAQRFRGDAFQAFPSSNDLLRSAGQRGVMWGGSPGHYTPSSLHNRPLVCGSGQTPWNSQFVNRQSPVIDAFASNALPSQVPPQPMDYYAAQSIQHEPIQPLLQTHQHAPQRLTDDHRPTEMPTFSTSEEPRAAFAVLAYDSATAHPVAVERSRTAVPTTSSLSPTAATSTDETQSPNEVDEDDCPLLPHVHVRVARRTDTSKGHIEKHPWYEYLCDQSDEELKACLALQNKIVWIDAPLRHSSSANSWGLTYNAAQFVKELKDGVEGTGQNRNRLLGGRFPSPETYIHHKFRRSFPNICPFITTSEFRGCKNDNRRASRFYKRRLRVAECAMRMGLPETPPQWLTMPAVDVLERFGISGITTAKEWTEAVYRVIGSGTTVEVANALGNAAFSWYRRGGGRGSGQLFGERVIHNYFRSISVASSIVDALRRHSRCLAVQQIVRRLETTSLSVSVFEDDEDRDGHSITFPESVLCAVADVYATSTSRTERKLRGSDADKPSADGSYPELLFDFTKPAVLDAFKEIYRSRRFCVDEVGIEWIFPGIDRRWTRRKLTEGSDLPYYARPLKLPPELQRKAEELSREIGERPRGRGTRRR